MGTQSRNTTFGIELGEGRSPAEILGERKVVTEGVKTAESITELGRRLGIPVPIAVAVNQIVKAEVSIDEAFSELFAHPPGIELADM
jgi:glycerol-3-phosphate dehydrogenase (NAD(P)+)